MLFTEKNIKQFRAFHRKKLNLIEIARPIYCQVMCRLKKELRILCDLWNTAGKHVSSCLCIFCCWNNVFSWQRKAIISGITQFNGIRVFDANAFSIIIRSTCCCIQNNSSCTNGILFGFQLIDFLWKQRNCGILIISSLRAGSFAFGSAIAKKEKYAHLCGFFASFGQVFVIWGKESTAQIKKFHYCPLYELIISNESQWIRTHNPMNAKCIVRSCGMSKMHGISRWFFRKIPFERWLLVQRMHLDHGRYLSMDLMMYLDHPI